MKRWVCGMLSVLLLSCSAACQSVEQSPQSSTQESSAASAPSADVVTSAPQSSETESEDVSENVPGVAPSSDEPISSSAPPPASVPSSQQSSQPPTSSINQSSSIPEFSGRADHVTSIEVAIIGDGQVNRWYLNSTQADTFMELLGKMVYTNYTSPETVSSSFPTPGGVYAVITILYDNGSSDELAMDLAKFHGDLISVQSGGDALISYIWGFDFLLGRWERGVCINNYIERQNRRGIPCSLEPIPES